MRISDDNNVKVSTHIRTIGFRMPAISCQSTGGNYGGLGGELKPPAQCDETRKFFISVGNSGGIETTMKNCRPEEVLEEE